MNNNLIMKFLEEQQYDIRVSGNGRWIDQKCAFDAVCFVADCIMDYIQNGAVSSRSNRQIYGVLSMP